ncbi:MAG: biopolymer transporter ExbD [Bdellovibrionota bacterium]
MFSRPSSRRKSSQEGVNINLVPMLDALVTLVAFLLFSTAFMAIVVLDTPAPLLAPPEQQIEKLKEKPLQLTAYIQPNQIILSDWSGSREKHVIPSVADPNKPESRYDLERLHRVLVEIKQRHPTEKQLIIKPEGGVAYEAIIGIMDAARFYDPKSDPVPYKKNEQGVDMPEKNLFSEVIFGNIMS